MDRIYLKIFKQAEPFLKKGQKKDFFTHTKWVVKSIQILLKERRGDESLLLPAAILHDVGWAKVPAKLQAASDQKSQRKALKLHLKYGALIAKKILSDLVYPEGKIDKIVSIILAHKFQDPCDLNKRLIIDADGLSDVFKQPFYQDVKQYKVTPRQNYEIRKKNKFYTSAAKKIFVKQLADRKKEIESLKV